VDRVHGAACRAQGGLEAPGRQRGVGVEPEQTFFRRRVADGSHVIHRVAKRDGLERGARRLDTHQRPKALVPERPVDGPQPVRTPGMARRRQVIEAGRVVDEKRGHRAIRDNDGYIYSRGVRQRPIPWRYRWTLFRPPPTARWQGLRWNSSEGPA